MNSSQRNKVMISSTALDLPEHRHDVIEAVLRQSCTPLAMETLTAADATAIEESLRLVDEADVYLGVFAHRYGWVPPFDNPDGLSITEMEYNRAVEHKIPRLIFFIDPNVPVKPSEVETGPGAAKLKKLKERIAAELVVASFASPKGPPRAGDPSSHGIPQRRRRRVPLRERHPGRSRSLRRSSLHAVAHPRSDRPEGGIELADRLGRRTK